MRGHVFVLSSNDLCYCWASMGFLYDVWGVGWSGDGQEMGGKLEGCITCPWIEARWRNNASRCIHASCVNTFRPRQNGRHFADDIFKCIFKNENVWILIEISLKFVPKGPINNIPALRQIMVWRRPGDKPLSEYDKPLYEPMMGSLPTLICITRPQWVHDTSGCINVNFRVCTKWPPYSRWHF